MGELLAENNGIASHVEYACHGIGALHLVTLDHLMATDFGLGKMHPSWVLGAKTLVGAAMSVIEYSSVSKAGHIG